MPLLSDLLDSTFFSGVPSNATYDLIKAVWKKAIDRSWEDLYLDAFQAALNEEKPLLEKYTREGGDIVLDRQSLFQLLHQDLAVAPENLPYSQISNDEFINKLADAMELHSVLIIGGHELSQTDYSQLIHNLIRHAKSLFKESILTNEQAFRRELIAETLTNQELLRQVQNYLINQFGLQVLERLETIEGKIDSVMTGVRDIKRTTTPFTHFMTLEKYLTLSDALFPQLKHFEEGLIYFPEKLISIIKSYLKDKHRALLVGRSASGKSVLAIALSKELEQSEGYEVFYRDASQAQGDAQDWWKEVVYYNDRPSVLYILDNCHLAPEKVNEFCLFWEGTPPKYTQFILISRSRFEEAIAESEEISYFDLWANETVEVHSQEIYYGVLEKYTVAYRRQDPSRYVALQNDNASLLRAQHAHNLVLSRSLLTVWRETGGQLSRVKQASVYKALIDKYLQSETRETLVALCILRQYEIPAHNVFVEKKLPRSDVKQLIKEKLLVSSTVQSYGRLYQLTLHPVEAREIFNASIYDREGEVTTKHVRKEIISLLSEYLKAKPRNYMAVYSSLSRLGKKGLEESILLGLLKDRDLQSCAADQFENVRIQDTLRYLSKLSKPDALRAQEMLRTFTQTMGKQRTSSMLLDQTSTFWSFQSLLLYLKKIDPNVMREIVAEIDMKQLARRIGTQDITNLKPSLPGSEYSLPPQMKMLMSFASLHQMIGFLLRLGYSTMQIRIFIEAIDMKRLAQRAQIQNLQNLYWLMRDLRYISPTQAKVLLENVPMQTLLIKANASDLSSIQRIAQYLHEIGYPLKQVKAFIEAIDMRNVVQKIKNLNLNSLYWLLRYFKSISPATTSNILEILTPSKLAFLCLLQKAEVHILGHFMDVSTKDFRRRFLQQFSAQELAEIYDRSSLGKLGTFFQYKYHYVKPSYAVFREQFLEKKLATESFSEIGKFIYRIKQVLMEGFILAGEVVDLLKSMDLSQRIASTDLDSFTQLIYTLKAIDERSLASLLTPLGQPEIMRAALEKSSLRGIQMHIHNIADMDTRYLQDTREGLHTLDLTDKLAAANIEDIAYFLWNVFAYIDPRLAQEYCKLVDVQPRSRQLREASLVDLCRFLWNLTNISELAHLQIFDDPIVEERLVAAWKSETGLGANLLGIVAIARSQMNRDLPLSLIETQAQKEHLKGWLTQCITEQNPYTLALTLYGLRAYNNSEAQEIVEKIQEASQLLTDATLTAVTPLSMTLLEEVLEWLEKLPADSTNPMISS